jgi:hypothetical protein
VQGPANAATDWVTSRAATTNAKKVFMGILSKSNKNNLKIEIVTSAFKQLDQGGIPQSRTIGYMGSIATISLFTLIYHGHTHLPDL